MRNIQFAQLINKENKGEDRWPSFKTPENFIFAGRDVVWQTALLVKSKPAKRVHPYWIEHVHSTEPDD